MSEKVLNEILTKLTELESNMATKQDIEEVKVKVDGVSEQVVTNAENISDIKDNQQAISNVINQMASIQERQETTIDLLARRSLDQEAEIKQIK